MMISFARYIGYLGIYMSGFGYISLLRMYPMYRNFCIYAHNNPRCIEGLCNGLRLITTPGRAYIADLLGGIAHYWHKLCQVERIFCHLLGGIAHFERLAMPGIANLYAIPSRVYDCFP